jgi:hypothetical protein
MSVRWIIFLLLALASPALAQGFAGPLVLDEVHRLENPSEILKIAADHFPEIRILATGSSTLGAERCFFKIVGNAYGAKWWVV